MRRRTRLFSIQHRLAHFAAILLFLFCFTSANAQLVTGFKVNGRLVTQGDTVAVCIGSSILYESTAQGYSTLNWRFQNGLPPTGNSTFQTVSYPAAGIDSVSQIISQGTERDSMYIFVKVNSTKPVAGFNFAPDGECGNVPVLFTNSSSGTGLTYLWNFGDLSTSIIPNPTHQFLNAIGPTGTQPYQVKLVVTNDQVCKDSITKTVTVKKVPDASIGNGRSPEVIFGSFNNEQTFRRCENTPSFEFRFTNISTTPAIISQYTIQWGDGGPDSIFTSWPAATIIKHTYPRGKSIMTVTVQGTNGCIGIKTYNVFLGTTPAGGYASLGNTSICAPNQLQFVITGYNNNALGTTYKVTTSDGTVPDNFQHPPPDTVNHIFNIGSCGITSATYANAFSSTLFVENPCGSTTVSVVPIYVSGKPRANFTFSPSANVCVNSNVAILNTTPYGGQITPTGGTTSTCTNAGRQVWRITPATGFNLTGGSTLGSLNGAPAISAVWTTGSSVLNAVFTTPGNYLVKLYVGNDLCGVDSIVKTICVRLPPVASFTMNKHEGCAPDTVTILNTSPVGTCLGETYSWSVAFQDAAGCGTTAGFAFVNGTSATTRDVQLRFFNPGRYIVSLTETALASGCPSPVFRDTFYVKAKPKVSINTLTAVCIGNPISPTATVSACYSTSPLIYNWTFTNGTPASVPTLIPGAIQYGSVGNFPISLNVENECGITTATSAANITNIPVANAGADKFVCSGSPASIGVSTGNFTYSWSPTTGLNLPATASPTVNLAYNGPNADTTYTYVLTVSAGANCSATDTVNVTVKKKPVVVITPTAVSICIGSSTTLVATGATTYTWSPASSLNTATSDTVIASPISTTPYTVTGTTNGCTNTTQATVTIVQYPNTNAGRDSIVCLNGPAIQFSGAPAGGNWSGSAFVSASGLFSQAVAGLGNYNLIYTASNGSCTRSDTLVVTVINSPVAQAGADSTLCQSATPVQLRATPLGGTWRGTPLITPGGLFTPSTGGIYTLIYQFGGGSCTASDTVIYTVGAGITNNMATASQTICTGTVPALLVGSTPSGGNGAPQYQWQDSATSLVWTNIASANQKDFAPPALTADRYYRRLVTTTLCSGTQTSITAVIKITVNPNATALFAPSPAIGCAPFNITPAVINHTPFNAAVSQYLWYANGVFIGNSQTFPGYSLTSPNDTVTIKLVAISRFGCKNDSMQRGFKTLTVPAPAFTKSDTAACGPLTVNFVNTTPNPALYSFRWSFGDGQTSNLQQPPAITYQQHPLGGDTVYRIRLLAFGGCDTITRIDSIKIKGRPRVLFTPNKTEGCSPMQVIFANTTAGPNNTYLWNFGDGTPTTNTDSAFVKHTFIVGVKDTFFVKLKATNSCGTDSLTYQIVVNPGNIRLLVGINGTDYFGCAPHVVRFFNNSSGANIYRWNFGDNNNVTTFTGIDTVMHTYTAPGIYTATLNATNNCTDTTTSITINVQAKPNVSFTASPVLACIGDTIAYTNLSDVGINNKWKFGNGDTSVLVNPRKTFTTAGTYRTWLTGTKVYAQGNSCSDSAFKDIIIRDTLPGAFTASDTVGSCSPLIVTFININRPANLTQWNFGDGSTATGDSVVHTFLNAGTYAVKMYSKGAGGCIYTAGKTIVVNGPGGFLRYTGGFACLGNPVQLEVVATGTTLYQFYFGDGDSVYTSGSLVSHVYIRPGFFIPYAYITNATCRLRVSTGDTIKVDRLKAGFRTSLQQVCGATTVSFIDTSGAFFGLRKWSWNFGDGRTDTVRNPVKIFTQGGTYNVRLMITGVSGCVDTVLIPVSIPVQSWPVSTIVSDTTACVQQPLSFTALVQSLSTIASYDWDFGNNTTGSGITVSNTYNQPNTYRVRLITRTVFGCADTTFRNIRVNTSPIINAGPDVTICLGTSAQLNAVGANSWQWTPLQGLSCTTCSNPIASPTITTTYIATGNNSLLCRGNDSITVTVMQPFTITVSPSDSICIGQSSQLFAGGAFRYVWDPAISLDRATVPNPVATPLSTTSYRVIGFDQYNCFRDTNFVRVAVGQYPTVDLGTGGVVIAGTRINLNAVITNGPIASYRWTPTRDLSCLSCGNPVATINTDILYKLEVENIYGCAGSDTISFKVNCDPSQVFIPNAFSPDGDGINDVLMVRAKGIAQVKYFRIFNRWGQLVFERSNINANDPAQGWNGKINGANANPDVYVYTAEATCTAGGTFVYKGNVTLVR